MALKDFRDFLGELARNDQLLEINERIDWNLEVGALTRVAMNDRGPALLFTGISDCMDGSSICSNFLTPNSESPWSRLALALGLSPNITLDELRRVFTERMYNSGEIAPIVTEQAAFHENQMTGDEIDLTKFPVPRLRGCDGGRYMGTWHIDISPNTESIVKNDWGMFRHMLLDRRHLGVYFTDESKQMQRIFNRYKLAGKDMPMVIAFGADLVSTIVAGIYIDRDRDEAGVAGALRQDPVRLVPSALFGTELLVPDSAEIVLEGYLLTDTLRDEGDFGEGYGYTCGQRSPKPVFRTDMVFFRSKPILPMSCFGRPWDEWTVLSLVAEHAEISRWLIQQNLSVRSFNCMPPGSILIVSLEDTSKENIASVSNAFWNGPALHIPYLVFVDSDIDPNDYEEVLWAISTRCHPLHGIQILSDSPGTSMIPFLTIREKESRRMPKVLLDATFSHLDKNLPRPTVVNADSCWPADILRKVTSIYERCLQSKGVE